MAAPLEVQKYFYSKTFLSFCENGPFSKNSWSNPMTFPFFMGATLGPLKPIPPTSEVISPVLR